MIIIKKLNQREEQKRFMSYIRLTEVGSLEYMPIFFAWELKCYEIQNSSIQILVTYSVYRTQPRLKPIKNNINFRGCKKLVILVVREVGGYDNKARNEYEWLLSQIKNKKKSRF